MLIFLNKHFLFLLLVCLFELPFTSFRDSNTGIDNPVLFKPANFYIANIADERATKGKEVAVFTEYIKSNLAKDLSLKPITIDINELTLTETTTKTGMVEGVIKLQLGFNLQKDYGTEHLLSYSGGMRYTRMASNTIAADNNIKSLTKAALVYLNTWMNNNIHTNRILANAVKIRFDYYKEKLEGDTIYYAANRPMGWADFKSTRKLSNKYAAVVMPNFGYEQHEEIVKGVIYVTVTLKTYLAKSDCWLNTPYKEAYILNHEQRHFDVAKIVTEQFKEKIMATKSGPDTFEGIINMQYLDSYRDMNKLQKDYDNETEHGLNRIAQEEWNKRIDRLLNLKVVPDA